MTPAGLLGSYWNLPVFSQASTQSSLSDKSVYSTLVRIGPVFAKMGGAVVELFRYFGWQRTVIVARRAIDTQEVFCDYAARSDLSFDKLLFNTF